MAAARLTFLAIVFSAAAVFAAERVHAPDAALRAETSPKQVAPNEEVAEPAPDADLGTANTAPAAPPLPSFAGPILGEILSERSSAPPVGAPAAPPVVNAPVPQSDAPQVGAVEGQPPAAQPEPQPAVPRSPPAKQLFGAVKTPSPLAARAIGSYAKGCLSGARPLAVDGPNWQAMRLSRNRNWGHPDLIKLIERFAGEVKEDGWPGLLVGDISQPRGGPMLTGHASHQIGLDADIWLTPMPDRRLSEKEREELAATSMLVEDQLSVNSDVWTPAHGKILKRAASYPEVERVLVHPAIKLVMCSITPQNEDRTWLSKIRPYWGHHYHFHIRMGCPRNSAGCTAQPPVPADDGCGQELVDWFKRIAPQPEPKEPPAVPPKPAPPKPETTLDQLPAECRIVLGAENAAGEATLNSAPKAAAKQAPKPKATKPSGTASAK